MKKTVGLILLLPLLLSLSACAPRGRIVGGSALVVPSVLLLAHERNQLAKENSLAGLECIVVCPVATTALVVGAVLIMSGIGGLEHENQLMQAQNQNRFVGQEEPEIDVTLLLPADPADTTTARMGMQTLSLASSGHCDGAKAMLQQVAKRDASYSQALYHSPEMKKCHPY